MTALADEEIAMAAAEEGDEDLDQVLWQAWKALKLPEGYRAEIIEGALEVSPTGRRRHGVLANRIRRALDAQLAGSPYAAYQDFNVIDGLKVTIPDVLVTLADLDAMPDPEELGVPAAAVALVVEIVSPGQAATTRDRVRKRRAYARANIPVYVIIDDHDEQGRVTVLTRPEPEHARYAAELSAPYGTEVRIPEGPAKDFAIDKELTAGR